MDLFQYKISHYSLLQDTASSALLLGVIMPSPFRLKGGGGGRVYVCMCVWLCVSWVGGFSPLCPLPHEGAVQEIMWAINSTTSSLCAP